MGKRVDFKQTTWVQIMSQQFAKMSLAIFNQIYYT